MHAGGAFDQSVEEMIGSMSKDFTNRWAAHSHGEGAVGGCGHDHGALVTDGHAKTTFKVCAAKNGEWLG